MMGDLQAPAHTVLSVQQFLTNNSMTLVPNPPYSPDLAVSDLFFVSLDEKSPQREMFCQCGRGETKKRRSIKIGEVKNCSEQWKNHLHRCIASNGEYFEGD